MLQSRNTVPAQIFMVSFSKFLSNRHISILQINNRYTQPEFSRLQNYLENIIWKWLNFQTETMHTNSDNNFVFSPVVTFLTLPECFLTVRAWALCWPLALWAKP